MSTLQNHVRSSAPRCKAGGRTPSDAAFPFGCEACTRRFLSKSGVSQHERFRHPDIASQRNIEKRCETAKKARSRERTSRNARCERNGKADRKRRTIHEAEEPRKRNLRRQKGKPVEETEAPALRTEWDATAFEIFRNIYCQMGDMKGLHAAVRVALQSEGYEISLKLKRISE